MTAEQFCLRWNNHQRTLVSVFDGLFESGTLVDCTLAADGQYLKAHKVVLCACSPYLEALLSQHYNQHPIVILKDVKFEELQAIMEYMYRGEVNVTQEQLGLFLKAAEMLQVKGLTYSDNKPGGASAQIVSSTFSVCIDGGKDASVVKPQDSKKKEKLVISPATGSQNSLVDTLKLLPSKLVIDIPPISPANSAKDGSVSPNPQKRKKLSPPQSEVKSVRSRFSPSNNSECATNNTSTAAAGHSKFVFDVDPTDIVNSQNIKIEESSEDSYDSDTLVVDEESGADKNHQEPGPSHASSAVADGCTWNAQGDDHPEATKDLGTLAAAMALTRTSAAFRAIASFDALRERERERPFVCERCGRHYAVSYTLDRHKKYECGVDKQFFCRKCFRPFSRADSMRVHMRNCLAKQTLNRTPTPTPSSTNDNASRDDYL